ncbi:MAG: TonB family protein [Betaproteobacteria bacterium]
MADINCKYRKALAAGIVISVALHTSVLVCLWLFQRAARTIDAPTMVVKIIPIQETKEEHRPPVTEEKQHPIAKSKPRPHAATRSIIMSDKLKPQLAESVSVAAPRPENSSQPSIPNMPVTLNSELSVVCSARTLPAYPSISRRLGEEGIVTLQVALDEHGKVSSTHIAISSGHPRLDEAARAAIMTWHCSPALHNAQPVRATALQPIKFILQGN